MDDELSRDPAASHVPGIFDLTTNFRALYREFTLGARSVMPAGVDVDDWADLVEKTCIDGWRLWSRKPSYFPDREAARRWARKVATWRYLSLRAKDKLRDDAHSALAPQIVAGEVEPAAVDDMTKVDCEVDLHRAIQLLPTERRRSVASAVWEDHLTRADAAVVLSLSQRVVRRELERATVEVAHIFTDYKARGTSATPHEGADND